MCSNLFSNNFSQKSREISAKKKIPIVSDGYIYIGIHSVSHGSSCFLILTGLPTNINVLRFYHIALYQADILRPVAFASPDIPNFSRQSCSRFSTFLYVFFELTLLESNAAGSPCRGAPTALGSFLLRKNHCFSFL